MSAALLYHEQARNQPVNGRSDDHRVRIGRRLHSRSDVGRIAEYFRLAAAALADHDGTAIDADPNRQFGTAALPVTLIERADRIDYRKSRACGAFSVVVVRFWPTEIRHHAVAKILRDKAAEAGNRFGYGAIVVCCELSKFLWVELGGDFRRAH